jgi:hypothetical protein
MMTRFAWKQVLITFAVSFVLGVAFGRWEFSDGMHKKKWSTPQEKQQWILKRLDSKLYLNAEQEKQITGILQETIPQIEAIRAKVRPETDAVREGARQRIRPLLTMEQQKKYDQMEAEWKERKRKYQEASGHP